MNHSSRRHFLQRSAGLALAASGGKLLAPGPLGPSRAQAAWMPPGLVSKLGAYSGSVGIPQTKALETWLGHPLGFVHDFAPTAEDWSNLYGQTYPFERGWTSSTSPYKSRMVLSVPMMVLRDTTVAGGPGGPTTLQAAVDGAYDAHWEALGRQLVRVGLAGARLRIAHEPNCVPGPSTYNGSCDWSAGHTDDGEQQYARAFRRMVTALRKASGQAFKIVYCPMISSSWHETLNRFIDPEACYPGDAYVDIISCDVYDRSWKHNTSSADRWADISSTKFGNTYCLDWFQKFASANRVRPNNDGSTSVGAGHARAGVSKPMAISEWGTFYEPWEVPGTRDGGDEPYFLYAMAGWMRGVGIARFDHFNYWNVHRSALTPSPSLPNWAAGFKQIWGT